MGDHIRVTNISGIAAAVKLAEQFAAQKEPESGACLLVCEEILLRLLNAGHREISVSVRGRLFRYIEISAAGTQTDTDRDGESGTEKDEIGTQISDCLLDQYADYYTYRYRKGINLYRVSAAGKNTPDLTEEIYGYYRDADPEQPHKPTDVLRHIARRHKGFFALSVLILLIKHLAALLLPVFVSNMISIVTDGGAFFSFVLVIDHTQFIFLASFVHNDIQTHPCEE